MGISARERPGMSAYGQREFKDFSACSASCAFNRRIFSRAVKACATAGALSAVLLCGLARPVAAQETHLLVVTGVAGDDEHAERFHKWASTIVDAAKKRGGVPEAHVTHLAEKRDHGPARIRRRSTKDGVE